MTEKRFEIKIGEFEEENIIDHQNKRIICEISDMCKKMNELNEENQFLKEKEKDMLDYLKQEYDYVYKQRVKHPDDAILVKGYELIEYHIRSMIEHLERL